MNRLRSVPIGTLAVSAGLLILGVCAYLFLLLTGRVLGDDAYAPLGALWILVFLLGPAFLYPIEQELSRAIAARRAVGHETGPVIRRAMFLAAGLAVVLVVVTTAFSSVLDDKIFNGDSMLLVGLISSLVSYAFAYVARGVFAGGEKLISYGVLIAGEGVVRLVAAVVLALCGVDTPGPYGLAVGLGPIGAVAVALVVRRFVRTESSSETGSAQPAEWKELTSSLGYLVAGGFFSQFLVSSAPLVVKYMAGPAEQAQAGAFAKAIVITRIPLFLFQAVQAVMLPRLTKLATLGERDAFMLAFRNVMLMVGAIGLLGTLGALAVGGELLTLFGSDTGLPRTDMTLLALGNAVFLLDMTAAQALIAVKGQAQTVVAWFAGVVVLGVVIAVPGDVLMRVELALIAGSVVALGLMLVMLSRQLGKTSPHVEDLVHALDPTQEHVEP